MRVGCRNRYAPILASLSFGHGTLLQCVKKTSAPPVHSLKVVKMFSEKSVVTSAGEHWQRRCLEKLGATQRDMGI
jgi:hypothetical protein